MIASAPRRLLRAFLPLALCLAALPAALRAQLTFDPADPPSSATPPTAQYHEYTGANSHQKGPKTVLVMLVRPSDGAAWTSPPSFATLEGQLNGASQSYYDASYHQTWFGPKRRAGFDIPRLVVTPVLVLPKTAAQYLASFGTLQNDCLASVRAQGADWNGGALDPNHFDRWVVMSNTKMIGSTGLAYVGGRFAWTGGSLGGGVALHEWGHNWGVFHANDWTVPAGDHPRSPAGSSGEYQDGWDVMGGNTANVMFNPLFRENLGFLERTRGEALEVSVSGTYRLWDYVHPDRRQLASQVRALVLPAASFADPKRVVLGFGHIAGVDGGVSRTDWNRHAVTVHSKLSDGSNRIDTTPGSSRLDDAADSSIKIGRTYSEAPAVNGQQLYGGFHVTPIARGAQLVNGQTHEWIDVVVNYASAIPSNLPPATPVISSSAPSALVGATPVFLGNPGAPLPLTASATDPDGDTLAWDWDFGRSGPGAFSLLNSPAQSPSYPAAGLHLVTATATDMKGGRATARAWVRIGSPPLLSPVLASTLPGLAYRYHEGNFSSLPDFGSLFPVKEGSLTDLSLSPRERADEFAFVFEAYLLVPTTDIYTFHLDAEDGARLRLHDLVVVDNNGDRERALEVSGSVQLTAGLHPLRLEYFHRTGDHRLQLSWSTLTRAREPLPASALRRLDPAANPAPLVQILSPAPDESFLVNSTVRLTASASDADGIARVQYFSDGALLGTSTDAAGDYEVFWSGVSVGPKTIVAVAYDSTGRLAKSSPLAFEVRAPEPRPSLGLNFGSGNGAVHAGEAVGAIYPNAQWNNYSAATGERQPIHDHTRGLTSARVTWASDGAGSGAFASLADGSTAAGRLLRGGLRLRFDIEPAPNLNPHAIVSSIPYPEYDVYLYFDQSRINTEDNLAQRFVLSPEGEAPRELFGRNSVNNTDGLGDYPLYDTWIGFREARATSPGAPSSELLGNYVVFRALTAPSFKIESARNNRLLPPDTTGRHGRFFNALQIVATPPTQPRVLLSRTDGPDPLREGGPPGRYSVRLSLPPTAPLTILVQPDPQLSTDRSSLLFTPTDWATPQFVAVRAADDSANEGAHTGTITHTLSASGNYAAAPPPLSLSFPLLDNDRPLLGVSALRDTAESPSPLPATFRLTRVGQASYATPQVVPFQLAGTAALSGDYTLSGPGLNYDPATGLGSLTLPAGRAQALLQLLPLDDSTVEGIERVQLTLPAAPTHDIDPAAGTATLALRDNDAVDYFTEYFNTTADFDLNGRSLTFTPSGSGYTAAGARVTTFPTGTDGFTTFDETALSGGTADNGWWAHPLPVAFPFFGVSRTTAYVGTNGHVSFAGTTWPDTGFRIADHFTSGRPRVSVLARDLDPGAGGEVRHRRVNTPGQERSVIFYQNVRNRNLTSTINAQLELFDDGRIRLTWLSSTPGGPHVVGLSSGLAATQPSSPFTATSTPRPFYASDFSTYPFSGPGAAPAFASTPPLFATAGALYRYDLVATDPDNDTPAFSAPTKPSWLTLTDHGDGSATLSGTPPASGSFPLSLQVSDASASSSQTFTLVVSPASGNRRPVFTSTPPALARGGAPFSVQISATDADGHTLTLSAPLLPGWLTLTDHGDGTATLAGTVPREALDSPLLLEAHDGIGSTAQAFTLRVNQPPRLTLLRPREGAAVLAAPGTLVLSADLRDDGIPASPPTLAWSLLSGPATPEFTSPAAASTEARFPAPGAYRLRLTADDGHATESATLLVLVALDPAALLGEGLQGAWSLDEATGSTAADTSGQNRDATLTSLSWEAGRSGAALSSDASTTRFAEAALPEPARVTVSAWLRASTLPAAGDRILWAFRDGGGQNRLRAYLPAGGRQLRILSDRSTDGIWELPQPLEAGRWTHLIVSYDRSSVANQPSVWLDGVAQTLRTVSTPSGSPSVGSASLRLLGSWSGAIDEVRVHDRLPTPELIELLRAAGPVNSAPNIQFSETGLALPGQALPLEAMLTDDGLPAPAGPLTSRWEKLSGPGTVVFTDAAVALTTATFSAPGAHTLRLHVDDGDLATHADLALTVLGPPPAPADFRATPRSATRIDLSWQDLATDETAWLVERRIGAGPYTTIATLDPDSIAYQDTGLSPSTPHTYRLRVVNAAGATVSAEAGATTLPATGDSFASWIAAQPGVGPLNGPLDNPSGDGLANLLKYALGLPAATRADPLQLPTLELGTDGRLALRFRRRSGGSGTAESGYSVAGINYLVETRPDLATGSWQSGATRLETLTVQPHGDGFETVTVRLREAAPRAFLRLRIQLVP
jgi:hypothetical protein